MLTGPFRSSARCGRESGQIDGRRPEGEAPHFETLEKRELLASAPVMGLLGSYGSGGSTPQSLVAADFNGDDIQDLAVANRNGHTVSILLGNGDGSFADAVTYGHGGLTPTGLAVGDFNGDTVPDIAVSNYSSNNAGVLIGFGDGTFWNTLSPGSGGSHPYGVAVGDFNADTRLDLTLANFDASDRGVGVLSGIGNGTFAGATTFTTPWNAPIALTAGQFNDDTVEDIAVARYYGDDLGDNTLGILDVGAGSITWFSSGGVGARSVAAADLDGDGREDIVVFNVNVGGETSTVGVLMAEGTDSFAAATTFAPGGLTVSLGDVAIGDFDGDGAQDISVTNHTSGTVGILAGNGDGTFADAATFSTGGSGPAALAVADFNGDGLPDIAVANDGSGSVSILLNGGAAGDEPTVTADDALVTVNEGETAQNSGTFSDADPGDQVTITASTGAITQDAGNNGGWTWQLGTTDGPDDGQTVTVTATDSEGASAATSFELTVNNVAPTTVDDGYAVDEDGLLQVDAASGLLANDTDPGDDPLAAVLVDGPANGAVVLNDDGSFTYEPNADFNGTDGFSYKANDGQADGNTAAVSITVNAVNDGPSAEGQSLATYPDEAVDIVLTGSDVETAQADLLFTVTSLPSSGVLMSNGIAVQVGDTLAGPALTYVPGIESDATSVSFTFTVTDAGDGASPALESAPATVEIAIEQYSGVSVSDGVLTFGGTAGVDTVTSNNGVLVINGAPVSTEGLTEIRIWAGDGDDSIDLSGLSIPTVVHAGAGDDTVIGGSADDLVLGGAGDDRVTGGSGHDLLLGGDDADRLIGSSGNDILISGGLGSDATLSSLRDLLAYWADHAVTTEESAAADELVEGDGSYDVLTGSSGADWFIISVGDRITDMPGKLKALINAGVSGQYRSDYVTFV